MARLQLLLTVHPDVTTMPRILQVMSRRGFSLTSLTTAPQADGQAVLRCEFDGPASWHAAIPDLLAKLVDVHTVQKET